jgi:hypothetical protein
MYLAYIMDQIHHFFNEPKKKNLLLIVTERSKQNCSFFNQMYLDEITDDIQICTVFSRILNK